MYKLYLDDIRSPRDTYPFTTVEEWTIARNYDEFVKIIEARGLPHIVSFDHDLSFEHYPFNEPNGGSNNPKVIPYESYKEKTGMDCAKYLVEFCINRDRNLPKWQVHSANPVGAANIRSYLKSYERTRSQHFNKLKNEKTKLK